MKYRKRPIVIEAEQFLGGAEAAARLGLVWRDARGKMNGGAYYIRTLEGPMRAEIGDWIITGIAGERYPCKHAIFTATYEAVTP